MSFNDYEQRDVGSIITTRASRSQKGNMYVFVYGTLKKDEPNYHWLTNEDNGKATFFHNGKTMVKYPLVISSRYNIPFLLDSPGTGKFVQGEIYEIDEKMLAKLDILEECPKLYIRRLEQIAFYTSLQAQVKQQYQIVEAWTYFLPDFRDEMLKLEFLDSYSSNGPHNKPYVARYIRDQLVDHRMEVKQKAVVSAAAQ